jgi:hypothetical protein
MFRLKNNNIDFECYPANFHGYDNKSAYICTQNKMIENFESSSSFLRNVKFVRLAPSGEGIETQTQGAHDLELSQIVIKDENGNNIAKNSKITGSPKLHPSQNQSWTVDKLISGDEKATEWPNVFAAQANGKFFVEVELANPSNVSEVKIYSRSDNPGPLNGEFTQVVWFLDSNRKVLAKRSMPGINLNPRIIKNLGPPNAVPGSVKFVRVERTDPNSTQGWVQFYQLMVLDENNTNVAYGQLVSAPHSHRPPEHGVDNFEGEREPSFNRNGNKLVHSHGSRKGDFYEITLASPTAVKQIKLYNRGDYSEPISHFKVMLLDSNRRELFSNNFNKENLQIINVNGPASVKNENAVASNAQSSQSNNNKKPLYIAVGDNAKVGYSSNGVDWTRGVLGEGCGNDGLHSIAYNGNDLLIAAAYSGSNQSFIFSKDGINWMPVVNANRLMQATVKIKYVNDMWYAAGFIHGKNDKLNAIISKDGITWNVIENTHVMDIAYGKGVYTALRDERDGRQGHIAWSRDAINWTKCGGFTEGVFRDGFDIHFNGEMFVAVYTDYGSKNISYSNDGINWTLSPDSGKAHHIGRGIAYGNNLWVAAFSNGRTPFLTSRNGINWDVSEGAKGPFEHGMNAHWAGDKWLLAGNGRTKLATTTNFNDFNRVDDKGIFSTQVKQIITFFVNPIVYPNANCDKDSTQVGFSCYPNSLVNKK